CSLPAGVRLPAAAAAGDSSRFGRVRVSSDQRGHHQGNLHHGDDPAQQCQLLLTTPLRIESSSLSSPVTEGQTLDLNCVIASPTQATVTWYKRGGSLPAKHQVGDTGGDVPKQGVVGLTHAPYEPRWLVQAQMTPTQAQTTPTRVPMAPLESKWPPCPLPAGVRLPAAA
ncbi:PGBM protein, partial [Todus mexicanus]|nr:PGBM protein [Todus mexicanus]